MWTWLFVLDTYIHTVHNFWNVYIYLIYSIKPKMFSNEYDSKGIYEASINYFPNRDWTMHFHDEAGFRKTNYLLERNDPYIPFRLNQMRLRFSDVPCGVLLDQMVIYSWTFLTL